MAECECLSGCNFYQDKMPIDSAIGQMYKKKYCLDDSTECARHIVFKKFGKGTVPSNLYPSQMERAEKILAGKEPHA